MTQNTPNENMQIQITVIILPIRLAFQREISYLSTNELTEQIEEYRDNIDNSNSAS